MFAKQTLLNWLAEDDLPQILQGLSSLAYQYKDDQLSNDASFQSGRLKALEKQKMNGTLSHEEEYLQAAKIRQALLQIIQDLPEDWTLDGMHGAPVSHAVTSKVNWKRYAVYITGAIALFAGIAEVSGYSLRDYFEKKETTEQPAEPPSPAPKISTTGKNSPAINTHDGDVNVNYGESTPQKDSTTHK